MASMMLDRSACIAIDDPNGRRQSRPGAGDGVVEEALTPLLLVSRGCPGGDEVRENAR
jgi:hypothetical protein